jgi:hypothetical protein
VGELSVEAIRSVVRRYSSACIEVAKRKRAGEKAHYPRRKRALVPLRWSKGKFRSRIVGCGCRWLLGRHRVGCACRVRCHIRSTRCGQ